MSRLLMLCAALALAGCAAAPAAKDNQTANAQQPPAGCVTSASRLPQSGCAAGQVYTQQDINRTGQSPNLGTALKMLDPAIH